jgi:AmmeMemoRadiSam system protein A
MLSDQEKATLLELARSTLEAYYAHRDLPKIQNPSAGLREPCGAFVTLTEQGELRGCIGHLRSEQELYHTIQQMAVAAATQDPRFRPVSAKELAQIHIEISVLSPMIKVADVKEIEIGRDGLYIVSGFQSGVLLPQVATEWGWDRDEFLEQVCRKAGLQRNAWKSGSTLYRFGAQVFEEQPSAKST